MEEKNRTQEVINAFTKAKQDMIDALKKAQSLIWEKLNERKSDLEASLEQGKSVEVLSNERTSGNGQFDGGNDRQLFRWTGLKVMEGGKSREYLIDLFYNEVGSNNFHSQIGHFQFAAIIPGTDSPHQWREDLEKKEGEPGTRIFQFNEHRVKNSEQYLSNKRHEDLALFDPESLVEGFFDFVKEQEEKRQAEKEG